MTTEARTTTAGGLRARWTVETIAIVVGLTLAWTLGIVGGVVGAGTVRDVVWGISSMGLVAGAGVLAVRNVTANIPFAAGLIVLVVGEGVIHSQGSGGVDAFASATLAYVPALILVAVSGWGPIWARAAALGSAAAFAAHAFIYLFGGAAEPEGPIASVGYALLALAMIGWTWQVVRGRAGGPAV